MMMKQTGNLVCTKKKRTNKTNANAFVEKMLFTSKTFVFNYGEPCRWLFI